MEHGRPATSGQLVELMTQEKAPLPLCSTLTPTIVASGAMPTVPMLLALAATMPATCVPCQNVPVSVL